MKEPARIATFIERWRGVTGSERANYQLYIADLCELLGLPHPEPAHEDTRDNAYVFERRVTFAHGDGTNSNGFIDCYRRGAFVLEAKKVKAGVHTKGFDEALMRARSQAEGYARALPAIEGRPPFLVVVDVGHVIELYADFTRSGATYTPFPDARSHRIRLDDLHDADLRERLRLLWLDPMALDPARASAKVTREVAVQLAVVAKSLEAAGHDPERVAAFLTRCLFSMFAEDVELLPRTASGEGAFVDLLKRYGDQPETLTRMLRSLWTDMDRGGFSAALAKDVLRFNGKLFKASAADGYVLQLNREQIEALLLAAKANWREVEPAIFGTLLERALDPAERHALGAHYTPRAYVERLVLPTVVEPLRADWANTQAAALLLATEAASLEGRKRDDKLAEARAEVRRFHHALCTVRVLDPACGSGNFLYVTLEHLKRLEGEVLALLEGLLPTIAPVKHDDEGLVIAVGEERAHVQAALDLSGETVTLQQLRGIEINQRAAAVAELVLWIGFLQWHLRTFGNASVAEPVIHDYGNIEHRDAVLAYDSVDAMKDDAGRLVSRWDGVTFKAHPVTGEDVPDESAQVPQWRYMNPRQATWPQADFIVGNPPFIGASTMRRALGDGYADALRSTWVDVPESADFVMHWWHAAAQRVANGESRRFGLITTNSLTQTFNRRVVHAALSAEKAIHLVYAIADHPWVDSADGAAVRICMTVAEAGAGEGELLNVLRETPLPDGSSEITFAVRRDVVHADLRVGANVTAIHSLQSNSGLSNTGVKLHGAGFIVSPVQAAALGLGRVEGLEAHIRDYRNGRDLTHRPRGVLVIDLHGMKADEVRQRFPATYQWVLERVKPERDQNREAYRRENWWLFGRKNTELRRALAGLSRYIATGETAKHRIFQFLDASIVPDNMLTAIALPDAMALGVLSSRIHVQWSLQAGGRLGVGNDPRYTKTRCFEPFPFPAIAEESELSRQIASIAEELDAHRKRQQKAHGTLTLTDVYNVLDALRLGRVLTAEEQVTHVDGLVSVLAALHDQLDALVLEAYGWSDLTRALVGRPGGTLPWPEKPPEQIAAEDELLNRIVRLNGERVAEEAGGTVRWLRPSFQKMRDRGEQATLAIAPEEVQEPDQAPATPTHAPSVLTIPKRPWPTGLPGQIKAIAEVLGSSARPLTLEEVAARFTARGRWRDRLPIILDTLESLGRARIVGGDSRAWQGQ